MTGVNRNLGTIAWWFKFVFLLVGVASTRQWFVIGNVYLHHLSLRLFLSCLWRKLRADLTESATMMSWCWESPLADQVIALNATATRSAWLLARIVSILENKRAIKRIASVTCQGIPINLVDGISFTPVISAAVWSIERPYVTHKHTQRFITFREMTVFQDCFRGRRKLSIEFTSEMNF